MPRPKNVPHVRLVSLRLQAQQQLICSRIHWSIEQFSHFQYEAGLEYLDWVLKKYPEKDKQVIANSAFFWGWWRNQWLIRDKQAYNELLLTEPQYRLLHTKQLRTCERSRVSFWSNAETMLADGLKRMKNQQ